MPKAILIKANLKGAKLREADLSKSYLEKADLSGADLSKANLNGADLNGANLSGADLRLANLSGALLYGANLTGADLFSSNLSGAHLHEADLSRANLRKADLSETDLRAVNLNEADLCHAKLSGALFEPNPGLPGVTRLLNIWGLDSLTFSGSHGLVELREIYKKAGMRDPERRLTFALNHTRRVKLWRADIKQYGVSYKVESLFNLVFFEWTCAYGMSPGRPLQIMGIALLFFTLPYLLGLRTHNAKTGIWLLLPSDRVLNRKLKDRPIKLTIRTPFRPLPEEWLVRLKARLGRCWRAFRLAFYFSLLSAFHIGWRELNVGAWITRLQKYEYNLRATGWVRCVSGFQSLLSVYMIALWALTYFGRPFE